MPKLLGTLLPLSAIGSFAAGEKFVEWLTKTHQQAWQLLPLHPSSASPYAGFGIGLSPLFITAPENLSPDPEFLNNNRDWLGDFGLFMALADHFKTTNWTHWPAPIRNYRSQAIQTWTSQLATRIQYHQNLQAFVYREYSKLRHRAADKNIQLIGDVPFYLALHSPLVWANQKAFLIAKDGHLPFVSGVIGSGYFPRQVWHHPLYNYAHLARIKKLWKARLRYAADLYDGVRLDSAISFYTYNKIHPHHETLDETVTGPGDKIVRPLFRYSRKLKIKVFIENVTDYDQTALQQSAQKYHVPGVAIYALNPEKFVLGQFDARTIYYSSNHDTPTLTEFTKNKQNAKTTRQFLLDNCPQLILPLQDWQLSTKRINRPGTSESKNWRYKVDLSKLKAP